MVDLPGYGYAKVSDNEKRRWRRLTDGFFEGDRDLRLVLQLCDMRHPPTADDRQMMEYLIDREIPFVLVLTKADKLNKTERAARMKALESELGDWEGLRVIPFSAMNGEGADEIREMIDRVQYD